MTYAAPASGALCVELLKQTRDPSNSFLNLPRSETIQDLSVFVAFLEWVKPNAPNAQLCKRVRDIIARVLDIILEAPIGQTPMMQSPSQGWNLELPTDFFNFEDFGQSTIMDTFGWVA